MDNNTALIEYQSKELELPQGNEIINELDKIVSYRKVIQSHLVMNLDYGKSFASQPKPSLFKAGAEKIVGMLKLSKKIEVISKTEDFDKPLFVYTVRCTLYKGDRSIEGVGSANSKEKKFQRNEVFDYRTKSYRSATEEEKVEYTYSITNTILKMASKRALVDAVLNIGCLSEVFTQDLEDYDNNKSYNKNSNNNKSYTKNNNRSNKNTISVEENRKVLSALRNTLLKSPLLSEGLAKKLKEKDRAFEDYLFKKLKFNTRHKNECWKLVYDVKDEKGKHDEIIKTVHQLFNKYSDQKSNKEEL